MRVGKLRAFGAASAAASAAALAAATTVLAALAGGCSSTASSFSLASGQTPAPAIPTMTPTPVPALGTLKFGTFPGTWSGTKALELCEDWAELRAAYVAHLMSDTKYQLERWLCDGEVRIALLDLFRRGVEELRIEGDGLLEVIDVEGELDAGHIGPS